MKTLLQELINIIVEQDESDDDKFWSYEDIRLNRHGKAINKEVMIHNRKAVLKRRMKLAKANKAIKFFDEENQEEYDDDTDLEMSFDDLVEELQEILDAWFHNAEPSTCNKLDADAVKIAELYVNSKVFQHKLTPILMKYNDSKEKSWDKSTRWLITQLDNLNLFHKPIEDIADEHRENTESGW